MKNKTLLVVLAAGVVVAVLPVDGVVKAFVAIALFGVFVFWRRGYLLVALGSRALNRAVPNVQKAWRRYYQGWKAGLEPSYAVMLGNLFVQRGDPRIAAEILDAVIERQLKRAKPDGAIIASARISRSMVYWVLQDHPQAIAVLEQVRSEGKADKNLYVNLVTYLIEEGKLDEAGKLIAEASGVIPESPGMLDNRGWHLLLTGQAPEAAKLYRSLIADMNPRFPEAYAHAAQAEQALGRYAAAAALYRQALEKPFYQTTGISREAVQLLLESLPESTVEDPAIPAPSAKAHGSTPQEETVGEEEDTVVTDLGKDDDREPNTDLTEEELRE